MRCKSCARTHESQTLAGDKTGWPTQGKCWATVLLGVERKKGTKGGESNGECGPGKQTSNQRVWVAMVYSTRLLHFPGSDSRHRLGEGVSMSRKSSTPYDRCLHRGLRSKQRQSRHDQMYEQETGIKMEDIRRVRERSCGQTE